MTSELSDSVEQVECNEAEISDLQVLLSQSTTVRVIRGARLRK